MGWIILTGAVLLLILVAARDRLQHRHPMLRVYPVVGRIPWFLARLKEIGHGDRSGGHPFSSEAIAEIRQRALTGTAVTSFGATSSSDTPGRLSADVALLPGQVTERAQVTVRNSTATRRVDMALLNFGALGFGPVSANTIRAVGEAARQVDCHQNTGEDGLTALHLGGAARLIWQVGTGYWGCRDENGSFAPAQFAETAAIPQLDLIELKLSQGAKPGAGGLLPALKNTPRVARILGVEPGKDIISPPHHSAFDSLPGMLEHIALMEQLSAGKPVGIKLCIGSQKAAKELVAAMERTGIVPAFITVDGGDGGTGAASPELQNHTGLSADSAIRILNAELRQAGLRNRTAVFAAGRVRDGFDIFRSLCLGADGCFFTRAPLVALGCVQARKCHSGTCPSGIATQNAWRRQAISPKTQGKQLENYYRTVVDGFEQLLRASGRASTGDLDESCLVLPDGSSLPPTSKGGI